MLHKRLMLTALAVLCAASAMGQRYSFCFRLGEASADTVMYIARHERDALHLLDTARRAADGSYTFGGKRAWPRGVYALLHQDGKRLATDFLVDGSQRFTIEANAAFNAESVRVKGSEANRAMYTYLATLQAARREADSIKKRQADAATRAEAEAAEKALNDRMQAYEAAARRTKSPNLFFEMMNATDSPDVADSVADKPTYFRMHYWDAFFADGQGQANFAKGRYTPQLYNKLNYFFFGMMYHYPSDTICAELDRLAARIGSDTAMLRYVFDHIEPRYFRSTRNIGWDAVWCHLAEHYYLSDRCPWASEGTLHNMRYNLGRLRQSLIGAQGQELWMMDTTQIDSPEHWHSSHRQPSPYVVLWFWDPDCHHCQEQSAQLKVLYDSLRAAGDRRIEVYAVGYEADVPKWVRYVREHDFRWVNVGGTNVNIDYQEAYNVHGAPTMIILDPERKIIMNKTLPISSLLQFIADDERKRMH